MIMIKDFLTLRLALYITDCTDKPTHLPAQTPSAWGGIGEYLCWLYSEVDAAATGCTYNTASNLWETQSLLCNENSKIK